MNQENKVVKIKDIVYNQIPEFIISDNPNFSEFLKQYYASQEFQGGAIDLVENLINYKNFDSFDNVNLPSTTTLLQDIDIFDDQIFVDSVNGYPQEYGLLKIDNEIITYTGISGNSFTGCVRGFSGSSSLSQQNNPEFLVFSETDASQHTSGASVQNLSNLFLQEFFKKIKYQFIPGFEEVDFDSRIDVSNFISKARTFYETKGTDEAYKILFKVLYGEDVKVIKPDDYTFKPSDDKWTVCESFSCELISGDATKLTGQTLYQDENNDGKILPASGSIYSVDRFYFKNKVYYKINLFSGYSSNLSSTGSIFGNFVETPKTYVVEDISSGASIITVDSTIGFEKSGTIYINDVEITYSDKTSNQFLNCFEINENILTKTEVYGNNFVYGYEENSNNQVKLRIVGSLSGIESSAILYATKGDTVKIDNLGNLDDTPFTKSLIYNLPLTVYSGILTTTLYDYNLEGVSLSNGNAKTLYNHKLKTGDVVDLYRSNFNQKIKSNSVVSTNNSTPKQYSINVSGISTYVGSRITAKRKLFKSQSSTYPEINNKFTANIQNSFTDENYNYITSNGFPNYNINPYKRQSSFTLDQSDYETLQGSHNFYDGELVTVVNYTISGSYSNPVGVSTGASFYVKNIDGNNIKLAYSAENVDVSSFISFYELVNPPVNNSVSGFISSFTLIDNSLYNNEFTSSKLFKKFPKVPNLLTVDEETIPGPTGILANGVEIKNYKSYDKVHYGQISSINVLNPGTNYDLTNPPRFLVNNGNDTQTIIAPQLTGKITELVVTDSGFNYTRGPVITISGGGNNSVKTEVKMKLKAKELEFNASSTAGYISDINDQFNFTSKHNLVTGEEVIYQTLGGSPIGIGTLSSEYLITDSSYYVINIGAGTSFRLSYTKSDALANNYILIREYGAGIQRFVSTQKKLIVDSVNLVDIDTEFKYKKVLAGPDDINHYDNIINIKNHGFLDNDEVRYSFIGTTLSGISTETNYYIHKIDNNRFKLKSSKTSTTYINIGQSDIFSNYIFEYSPIRVNISGSLAIDNQGNVIGSPATIKPIILGSITEVRVGLFGQNNYGSYVLNYIKSPSIKEVVGSGAKLEPVVVDGKIVKVIIKTAGNNYYNSINLVVEGSGYGAKLEPSIVNGQFISVAVVNGGVGYNSSTNIKIESVGKNLKLSTNLQSWNVNDIFKLGSSNVNPGVLLGKKHSYFGNTFNIFYLNSNLWSQFNIPELSSTQNPTAHSPIIGWSYDGCPIYGPDAYTNVDGTGGFLRMTSSYRIKSSLSDNRPDSSTFLPGFFISDYEYVEGLGTLDKYNGRFCVTPEFPNGVYAYFCTMAKNRNPVFPYFVGNFYKYKPEQDNFNLKINQDLEFNNLNISKHTLPYGVENKENYYEYFNFNQKSNLGEILITNTSRGKLSDILVVNGGFDYSIGDRISFNNSNTGGFGALAEVSELSGVGITSIQSSSQIIPDVTLTYENGSVVGIATTTHNIKDQSFIRISGVSTSRFSDLEGFVQVNVPLQQTLLSQGIQNESTTGIVTSIQVKDSILNFEVDSLIKIESETLKVIGLDFTNNFINVLRETNASSHNLGTSVTLLQSKFNFDYSLTELPNKNETYYFNPSQSVSVGVSTAIGVGNTLSILPLGYGVSNTQFVPTGRIFLPNHKFKNGEKVTYEFGQNSIVVSGVGNLSGISSLYVVKIDENIIGLTSSKTTTDNTDNLLLYTSAENNYLHKLKSNRSVVTSDVITNATVVSTAQTHGLSVGDKVYLNVISGVTTTYIASYSTSTAKLRINSQNNPSIDAYENETLTFNLSSSTLSGTKFKLYTDSNFTNEYLGNLVNGVEVIKTPTSLSLSISEHTPKILYYNIESETKKTFSDESVFEFNQINITPSLYNKVIAGINTFSETSFELNYPIIPENRNYTSTNSTLSYNITSSTIPGSISKIKLLSKGTDYQKLPKISSISGNGVGANLIPISTTIGKVLNSSVTNDESILPIDKTLKPFSQGSSVIFVYNNYKVGSLSIIERGSSYLSAPKVNLYSTENNTFISDFVASVSIKNGSLDQIELINPSSGLLSTDDKIVFTENDNGIKILGISTTYASNQYAITLTLETPISGFTTSNPLPFFVNDEVFVDGIQDLLGNGYNSSDYDYNFFKVVGVQTAYGSENAAQITYQISKYPGIFLIEETLDNNAYVVNSKYLPQVTANLVENVFYSGENIDNSSIVENLNNDPITNLIKVKNPNNIKIGSVIFGKSSLAKGKVYIKDDYNLILKSFTSVPKTIGWKTQQGQLSSTIQKLPDNDYYQRFSYSLKSKKSISDWDSIVSDVSHVAGYKKFSDLTIESVASGISSITADDSSKVDISINSYVDLNTVNDFDLVFENVEDYNLTASDIITFNSKVLSDYLLSKENLVLKIDDISNLFTSITPPDIEIPIDVIEGSIVSKYIFLVQSSNSFLGPFIFPQFFELLIARNGSNINLTSYSYFESNDLGRVTAKPLGDNSIEVNYVPINSFNSLSIKAFREDASSSVGIATTSYGYVRNVKLTNSYASEVSPTQKIIYSVPLSEASSGTLFVGISSTFNNIECSYEMAFLYDSGVLQYNTYAQNKLVGLGTVGIATSGSNLIMTYNGVSGIAVTTYGNITLLTNTLTSPSEILTSPTRLNSSVVSGSYTLGNDEIVSTISDFYAASKYGIEVTKTVGVTTQKSFILLDLIHNQQNSYLNNINYSVIGNLTDLSFETTYDSGANTYVLYYIPADNADYSIKFFEKNILTAQS